MIKRSKINLRKLILLNKIPNLTMIHVFMFRGYISKYSLKFTYSHVAFDIITDNLDWTQPSSPSYSYHYCGMIRTLTCLFMFHTLLDRYHHLQSKQKMRLKNGALNIKEELRKFVPIIRNLTTTITSTLMVSYDHMTGFLLAYFQPGGNIHTTVAVKPVTTTLKTQYLIQHRLL